MGEVMTDWLDESDSETEDDTTDSEEEWHEIAE